MQQFAVEVSVQPVLRSVCGVWLKGCFVFCLLVRKANHRLFSSGKRLFCFWRVFTTCFALRLSVIGCSLSKGRPKNKTRPTRGLDLEEVRRRTSLLSGESRAPVPTTSRQAAAAPRPAVASSYFDAGWGRQHAPPPASEAPHPLHAAAAASAAPVEAEGNYFNEEFLRAREQEGREGGRVMEQTPRGGDRLMDSAGSILTTARSVMLICRKHKIVFQGVVPQVNTGVSDENQSRKTLLFTMVQGFLDDAVLLCIREVGHPHHFGGIKTSHDSCCVAVSGMELPGMGLKRFCRMPKPGWMRWAPAGRVPARTPGNRGSAGLLDHRKGCDRKEPRANENSM